MEISQYKYDSMEKEPGLQ